MRALFLSLSLDVVLVRHVAGNIVCLSLFESACCNGAHEVRVCSWPTRAVALGRVSQAKFQQKYNKTTARWGGAVHLHVGNRIHSVRSLSMILIS